MKVLFLDAYFAPEQIAFTHLEEDLHDALIRDGHEIEVICPTPTRLVSDEVRRAYRNKKEETVREGKIRVTRFSAPREGKNPLLRALRYFWCNWRTVSLGKKRRDVDVVFADSTPPTQGFFAGKVAKKLGVPLLYSLQDVFPDSLETTGLAKRSSLLWKIGRRIEDATYRGAHRIVVISPAMRQNLLQKGVPAEKLCLISNWADLERILPLPREENPLFEEFSIPRDGFIVLYAGNFGAAQGAEIVLDAAKELAACEEIRFVIFGGGAGFEAARERAKTMKGVFIHPLLPQERVGEVYSLGDVALITCKAGVGGSGMPSKTWSILACNTPVIASFDPESDLADVLAASGGGVCVPPGDAAALAGAIREAYEAWKQGKPKEGRARDWALQTASRDVCVKRYLDALQACVQNGGKKGS